MFFIHNEKVKVIFLLTLSLISFNAKAQSASDKSVLLQDEKITYKIPMGYELMHIAFALTNTSIVSNGYNIHREIFDTESEYYREVRDHFGQFKDHPLIHHLNEGLRKSPFTYLSNLKLGYNSKMKDQSIVRQSELPLIRRIAYRISSVNRKHLRDFAKVSGFGQFYENHRDYYRTMLEAVKSNAQVNQQQAWLESQFPARYEQYHIVVSPLMGSTHFTNRFTKNQQRQCIMWVSKFEPNPAQSLTLNSARYIGVVMTEIDHNYVNPVSDSYKKELESLMGESNRAKWTDGGPSNSYTSGYRVFNEYMTHSVYLLYAVERLEAAEREALEKAKISSMEKARKFIRFGSFYEATKQLYTQRKPNETLTDLYPQILAWCKTQNGL